MILSHNDIDGKQKQYGFREEATFAWQKVFNEANAYFEELKEDEQEKPEEGDVRLRGRSCGCRVSPPILPHKPLQVLIIELLD